MTMTKKESKQTEEHNTKISEALRNKPKSVEHRKNLSIAMSKKHVPVVCQNCGKTKYVTEYKAETKKYCSPECFYADECSDVTKEKHRQAALGNKNGNWQGGKSFEKYGMEFNNELREKIRQRDNYKCQLCWSTENEVDYKLSIHHIDYNKKNNDENNLILLCKKCHGKTNFTREDWQEHFKKLLKRPKIFVSVLNQGWIKTELTFALVKWFKETDYRVYLEAPSDRPIENNRNKITKRFLRTGYDYLLQIDADNIPAKNPLTLVEFKKDIISCPVPIYSSNTVFLNVFKENDDGSVSPLKQEENTGLVEVDATGTGIIMCSRKILETIKRPFERQYNDVGIETLGLDLFFSQKAKEANFKIFTHLDYISKHYKEIDLLNFNI